MSLLAHSHGPQYTNVLSLLSSFCFFRGIISLFAHSHGPQYTNVFFLLSFFFFFENISYNNYTNYTLSIFYVESWLKKHIKLNHNIYSLD
jgi:hypothetical protein